MKERLKKGQKFYKFDDLGGFGLSTYTIKEHLPKDNSDPYERYTTEENKKQFSSDSEHMLRGKNWGFCDKYIDNGIYDNIHQAAENILSWHKYYTKQKDEKYLLFFDNIIASKDFKEAMREYPSLVL